MQTAAEQKVDTFKEEGADLEKKYEQAQAEKDKQMEKLEKQTTEVLSVRQFMKQFVFT